jgi:BirA family biotin operon repressor/biotin-[acetyl-CoA-carboxylase] ligase
MNFSNVKNPFQAPVVFLETVTSTMDESRRLAAQGAPHGTVVSADYQESGRGRTAGRSWTADRGKNLFATILLRYSARSIPQALTLRTGLAVSLAVEDLAPSLAGAIAVKWPNDIMIRGRKAAGILTEGDGKTVFIGLGVNAAQADFPEALRAKATSLLLEGCLTPDRERLLERILHRLHEELEPPAALPPWQDRLNARLYRRDQTVRFIPGPADSSQARIVEGRLAGIGPLGELLIIPQGEQTARSFITGELEVY